MKRVKRTKLGGRNIYLESNISSLNLTLNYIGIVFLLFDNRWKVGHVFFLILVTHFQKVFSARKTAIVKLCFGN